MIGKRWNFRRMSYVLDYLPDEVDFAPRNPESMVKCASCLGMFRLGDMVPSIEYFDDRTRSLAVCRECSDKEMAMAGNAVIEGAL